MGKNIYIVKNKEVLGKINSGKKIYRHSAKKVEKNIVEKKLIKKIVKKKK